jgi:hypothetical protein
MRVGPTRFDFGDVRCTRATVLQFGVCTHLATLRKRYLLHGRGRYSARRIGMPSESVCVPTPKFCFVPALCSFFRRFCAFPIHHLSGKRRMGICCDQRSHCSRGAGTCHAHLYACPFRVCLWLLRKLTLFVLAGDDCPSRLLTGNERPSSVDCTGLRALLLCSPLWCISGLDVTTLRAVDG